MLRLRRAMLRIILCPPRILFPGRGINLLVLKLHLVPHELVWFSCPIALSPVLMQTILFISTPVCAKLRHMEGLSPTAPSFPVACRARDISAKTWLLEVLLCLRGRTLIILFLKILPTLPTCRLTVCCTPLASILAPPILVEKILSFITGWKGAPFFSLRDTVNVRVAPFAFGLFVTKIVCLVTC